MNHKRRKPKSARAGCLLCKPNKLGKGMENKLGHRGFGNFRRLAASESMLCLITATRIPYPLTMIPYPLTGQVRPRL